MSYLNNTVDNATDYKGKLDESVNLLREPPLSNTTAAGVAGVDYEVVGWASITLTSGLVYAFKAHVANAGACHVDHGGSPVNIKTIAGSDPPAGVIPAGGVPHLLYNGTNLVIINPQAEFKQFGLGVNHSGNVTNYSGDMDSLGVTQIVYANSPTNGPGENGQVFHSRYSSSFAAQLLIATASANVYSRSQNAGVWSAWNIVSNANLIALAALSLSSSGDRWGVITHIANDGIMEIGKYLDFHETDADAKNYDGRLSVESGVLKYIPIGGTTADVGLVDYNQALDPGANFTAGNGWLTVIKTSASTYLCTYTALDVWTHSSGAGAAAAGVIPAAYRPNSNVYQDYYAGSDGIGSVRIQTNGNIGTIYRDWAGSLLNRTSIGNAFSVTWVAGGS